MVDAVIEVSSYGLVTGSIRLLLIAQTKEDLTRHPRTEWRVK